MSFLPDDLKIQTFKCPSCSEYISTDREVCNHCGKEIDIAARDSALTFEADEKKRIQLRVHKGTITGGALVLGAGVVVVLDFLAASFLSERSEYNILGPLLIFIGVVTFLYGVRGYVREKRR